MSLVRSIIILTEYPGPAITCVGVLWRTRSITIDAILILWDANKWRGILQFSLGVLWRTRNITIDTILIQWDANKCRGILQFSSFKSVVFISCETNMSGMLKLRFDWYIRTMTYQKWFICSSIRNWIAYAYCLWDKYCKQGFPYRLSYLGKPEDDNFNHKSHASRYALPRLIFHLGEEDWGQAHKAQNTWCMRQLVYKQNGKSPIAKIISKIV